ncbi:MAG: hypothetical protein AB3X44_12975 [Leptothrix sp. (in: b-proteobacteria)]
MSDSKDPIKNGEKISGSFFRKVVRFVANPTTDWADLNNVSRDSQENDYARTELKAMIERKRRNDFVRKREFDMLRKIRREGLTGEGIANLEGLSHMDDSEVRPDSARPDASVKAKIDAIEQQMVGEAAMGAMPQRRGAAVMRSAIPPAMSESFFNATTAPQVMQSQPVSADAFKPTAPMELPSYAATQSDSGAASMLVPTTTQSLPKISVLSPLHGAMNEGGNAFAVEVTELAHDPELDEAVIAFANADYEQCERSLLALISGGGSRAQHSETWFALFDLYRATGQQQKFEALAMDYVQRFGWSAPQWFSLPRLVADALKDKPRSKSSSSSARGATNMGWVAPDVMDISHVGQLRSLLLQMPLPWVLDWRSLRRIDLPACLELTRLLQDWADEPVEMRWVGGERFFTVLAEMSPTGNKNADPAIWLLRLEAQRLANQVVEFDQTAIDYCLTYEVSPPSWAPARCSLRIASGAGVTISPSGHQIPDVATGFFESEPIEEALNQVASVELSGQLVGDISTLLKAMEADIGMASIIKVSCTRLIRIDFIAAGDLLNWVLVRRSENRSVHFEETHRLVALFCGAMGINEHARVTVRNI